MSAQSDAIYTVLNADATLLTTLTGGVLKYAKAGSSDTNGIGRLGISKVVMAAAYDSKGLLKPCAIVKARSLTSVIPSLGGGYDHAEHYRTVADVVEVYLITDGDSPMTPLNTAALRVEHLIDMQFVGGGWWETINLIEEDRDPDLDMALYKRIDFRSVRGKYL